MSFDRAAGPDARRRVWRRGATEASYFAPDAPTVAFGTGVLADGSGPVAHADREYVRLSDVAAATDAVRETVETLLGG